MTENMETSRGKTGNSDDLETGEFSGRFNESAVDYAWEYDPSFFHAFATCDGRTVATLDAEYKGNGVMLLSDIKFRDYSPISKSLMTHLWRKFSPTKSYRGRGIGTRLLETFMEFCRNHGITEIYGSVVQKDLNANRSLIRWYERHGFVERPPDDRVLPVSASMVLWTARDRAPSPEN